MRHLVGTWYLTVATGALAVASLLGCSAEKQPKNPPQKPVNASPPVTPKASKGVRCKIPAATLSKIKAASGLLEVSDAEKGAWVQMMLDKCTGWPGAIKLSLKHDAPGPAEDKLSLPSATMAQRKEVDRLLDKMCAGLVKRLIAATKKGNVGGRSAVWKHCKFAGWKVLSKREWLTGVWINVNALVIYRLLAEGGQPHGVARTLARLQVQRSRVNEKEGEMLLVRSNARTVFVRGTEVLVSASSLLVDNRFVATVKNGKTDANTMRDGPGGYYIDPLVKALQARLKATRMAAKKGPTTIAPPLMVAMHKSNPYKLVAAVLYSAAQAGYSKFQLAVRSNVASDAAVMVDVALGGKAAKPAPRVTIRMTPTAYELRHANGKLASTHPAQPLKAAAARAALAKAMHARSVKGKTSAKSRGVVHLQVGNTIPYSDVILLLGALRVHPGMAVKGGCPLLYNPRTGDWAPAPGARMRCMYYRPRLQLVNP